MIIAEEQVETMPLIICDQLEAQDSSKAWHHLCCAEAALLAKLWRR
jgi:hypothetical protein